MKLRFILFTLSSYLTSSFARWTTWAEVENALTITKLKVFRQKRVAASPWKDVRIKRQRKKKVWKFSTRSTWTSSSPYILESCMCVHTSWRERTERMRLRRGAKVKKLKSSPSLSESYARNTRSTFGHWQSDATRRRICIRVLQGLRCRSTCMWSHQKKREYVCLYERKGERVRERYRSREGKRYIERVLDAALAFLEQTPKRARTRYIVIVINSSI